MGQNHSTVKSISDESWCLKTNNGTSLVGFRPTIKELRGKNHSTVKSIIDERLDVRMSEGTAPVYKLSTKKEICKSYNKTNL